MKAKFDEEGKILNKDSLIREEIKRLTRLFTDIPEKQKKVAESIIRSDAFQTVNLLELESILNKKGFIEEYQNGANQSGWKESSESKAYTNLAKTHLAYRKQLQSLLPKASLSQDDGFDEFVMERED